MIFNANVNMVAFPNSEGIINSVIIGIVKNDMAADTKLP